MKVLRWIGLVIAAAALSFFLWVLAIDAGVVHEISHPATVKKILADSGIYKTAVETALSQKGDNDKPNTINVNGQEVATSDPVIKAAAEQAFPPEFVQQNVEQVIDSFNSWLNGQTSTLQFKIDLTAAKANFAKDVASGLQARLTGLPACTDGTTAATFNAFTATCLPKGMTPAAAATTVQNSLATSQDFFGQGVYTAKDIKDDKGQPVFQSDKATSGRHAYDQIKASPFFIGLTALLAAVAVFFLSSTRRRGLRRVGIVVLIVGVIILLFNLLLNAAINNAKASSSGTDQALQESAIKAGKSLVADLNHIYYPLGGAYAGIGAALIIGSFFIKPRGGKSDAAEPATHKPTILDEPDRPMEDKELKDEKPKPAPKPAAKPKQAPKPKAPAKPKPTVTKINIS